MVVVNYILYIHVIYIQVILKFRLNYFDVFYGKYLQGKFILRKSARKIVSKIKLSFVRFF